MSLLGSRVVVGRRSQRIRARSLLYGFGSRLIHGFGIKCPASWSRRLRTLQVNLTGCIAIILGLGLIGCAQPNDFTVQYFEVNNPSRLSEWGVLKNTDGTLSLGRGTKVYHLASPLFSDYAGKLRTLSLPEGETVKLDSETGRFIYPVGTVITKSFYYRRAGDSDRADYRFVRTAGTHDLNALNLNLDQMTLLETRILVKRASGWAALPYVWDEMQTDAILSPTGALVRAKLENAGDSEAFAYVVPNTNQCAGCHTLDQSHKAMLPIGPHPKHLVRGQPESDQLASWVSLGQLSQIDYAAASQLDVHQNWQNPSVSQSERVLAYLDINCGHCHSPTGPADTSGLFLNFGTVDPIRWGVCKAPIAAGQGTGGAQFGIVPGDPDASIMSYRLSSVDPGAMMPELGRSLVHEEGLALVRSWIAAMPGDCDLDEPEPPTTLTLIKHEHTGAHTGSLRSEPLGFGVFLQ